MASKNVYFNIIAADMDAEAQNITAAKKENYTCKEHVKLDHREMLWENILWKNNKQQQNFKSSTTCSYVYCK